MLIMKCVFLIQSVPKVSVQTFGAILTAPAVICHAKALIFQEWYILSPIILKSGSKSTWSKYDHYFINKKREKLAPISLHLIYSTDEPIP